MKTDEYVSLKQSNENKEGCVNKGTQAAFKKAIDRELSITEICCAIISQGSEQPKQLLKKVMQWPCTITEWLITS